MADQSAPELPGEEAEGNPDSIQAKPTADSAAAPAKQTAKKSSPPDQAAVLETNEELKAMVGGDDDIALITEDAAGSDDASISGEEPLSDELADELSRPDDEPEADTTQNEEEAEGKSPKTEHAEESLPDDPETQKAIEEIVAEEADAVLAAEDEERDAKEAEGERPKDEGRLKKLFKSIWEDPRKRWAALGILTVIILALALIPHSRYFVLNTAGVRASVNLRVVDGGTMQPLRNVTVKAGGASVQTDGDGVARLEKVRLGRTLLQIEKRAFAPTNQPITVGWGSNLLGEYHVSAVGTQYVFYVRDFLSGRPIERAEAMSGEGNASSDKEGKLVLTLDTADMEDSAQISVEIIAGGYRKETVNLTANNKEAQSVDMVPGHKHVFVSKRSGNYDVYAVYADGRGEQKLVSGTGLERDDIALVPYPAGNTAALVATRERVVNPGGYLLSTLYLVDTTSGELVKIDQSEQIQIIGWSNRGRLVYVKVAAGASGTDPKRHRLMSFDSNDFSAGKELAASNSFNDVLMAKNRVYYAPSNIFAENPEPGLFGIDPDGGNRMRLLDKEVFTIVRSDYDTLALSIGDSWYSYSVGSPDNARASAPPLSQSGRIYVDNPDNSFSLWVDNRDGRGVLLKHDPDSNEDDVTVATRSGLKLPVYWLNQDYAVFRVRDGRETADYVVHTSGGEVRKITDATDTAGISRWFYY